MDSVSEHGSDIISDYKAEQIVEIAELFFKNIKNAKRYRKWHVDTYGCLPEELQNEEVL